MSRTNPSRTAAKNQHGGTDNSCSGLAYLEAEDSTSVPTDVTSWHVAGVWLADWRAGGLTI